MPQNLPDITWEAKTSLPNEGYDASCWMIISCCPIIFEI